MEETTISVKMRKHTGCTILLCHTVWDCPLTGKAIEILEGMRTRLCKRLDYVVDVWYSTLGERIEILMSMTSLDRTFISLG